MSTSPAYVYVLTALAAQPRHGLGVAEVISDFTSGSVILGPGTLYRCLKDLSADRLIEPVAPPEDDANAHRKYYAITDAGRAELASALADLDRLALAGRRGLKGLNPAVAS